MSVRKHRRGTRRLDSAAATMTTLTFAGMNRLKRRRGVTMIEYVLLIAIAVVLAWLLREQLSAMFNDILASIKSALNTGR